MPGAKTGSSYAAPMRGGRSTWTLISVTGHGDALKIWHQHGEGTSPVRLRDESVGSTSKPSLLGRAFVCPECEDTTVVGRPDAEPVRLGRLA